MEEHSTIVSGAPARWLEHGSGRPVVLVHGIPTSPTLWRHVMPLLNGRSLAWELRGYGGSIPDGVGQDLSVSAQATYLLEWLDALRLPQRPILVGHDLGGGVAQVAAARDPSAFAGLVLTNAVCYDSWPIPSVKVMQRLAWPLSRLPGTLMYPSFVQLVRRGHDDPHRAAEAIDVHWAPYAAHGTARSLLRQMTARDARDTIAVADRLGSLGLPAYVVWGEDDQFQKLAYGERLAKDLRAQLRRIPAGKHFVPEDHPDAVATAINGLLEV